MSKPDEPRVLVIGELNVDIVATGIRAIPEMGTEIVAGDCQLTLGSASAIFAAGMAKLGHPVTFVSQVGKDNFGDFCIRALRTAGVSAKKISRNAEVKTGVTIALSGVRDRALVTYPGAIESFNYDQLNMSLLRGHQHLHLTSYFLQKALRSSFPQIFRQARAGGLTTSFDPNSDPTSSWSKTISKVFRYTNVLFMNRREALQLTHSRTVQSALQTLGQLVPCAVVKLGAKGAIAMRGSEVVAEQGFNIQPLDTTGAGDSFAAGFISAYLRGASLADCLRTGNACGALSALKPGGTAGQPNAEQLSEFVRSKEKRGGNQ
jgi:sugar/nucleoside kinase (ribokinase family)